MAINVGTAIGYLDLDTSGWRDGLDEARRGMQDFREHERNFSSRMEALGGTMTAVGKTMTVTMTTSLTAIGGMMASKAKEMQAAVQEISRAVGKSVEEVERYKDVISSVYADNIGESFEDIAQAIALITQQMGDMDDEVLEGVVASALQLRDVFDIDVNESIRGANALMKNFGLSAEEAYNYIAIGAQNGLNQNKDLADQIAEYSVYYADLGMNAQDMFNAMYAGAKTGVYQIDYLNDAYKEFGIRVKDTAVSTTEGFALLGLNADKMRAKFAQGGKAAREAFDEVIQALAETDDKVIQNQAGVDLFGTKWEDIGQSAIMAITQMNEELDLTEDVLGDMRELTMDDLSRQVEVLAESFGRLLLPVLLDGTEALSGFVEWLNSLDPKIKDFIVKIGLFSAAAGPALMVAGKLASSGTALVAGFSTIAPIIARVATAVGGLVNPFTVAITVAGLLYSAYQANIGGIKDITEENIQAMKEAWENFIEFAPEIPEKFIGFVVEGYQAAENAVYSVVDYIISNLRAAWDNFVGYSTSIPERFVNFVVQGFNNKRIQVINAISNIINDIWGEWNEFLEDAKSIPMYFIDGLVDGIYSGIGRVASAVRSLGNRMLSALMDTLDENSPSKEAFRIGGWYDEGLALGVEENERLVMSAMESLGEGLKKSSIFDLSDSFDGLADGYASAISDGISRGENRMKDYMSELSGHAGTMDSEGYEGSVERYPGGVVNKTYNFYSNEKMTPAEISKQFKKTEQDLALGF